MTAFYFSRSRVALNLLAVPLLLVRHMFKAGGEALRDVREDFIPAIRYVLTGTDVPGATRAAVKSSVSTAAVAVASPVARFWRDHVATRLAALIVFLLIPAILLYSIFDAVAKEVDWADMRNASVELFKSIFTGKEPLL
jgi:hypothetical protein